MKTVLKRTPKYEENCKYNKILYIAAIIVNIVLMLTATSLPCYGKGVVLLLLYLYGTLSDIQERKVADFVSVGILITGLVEVTASELIINLFSAVGIFGIVFLLALLFYGRFGGADIKVIGASVFAIGMQGGMLGTVLGLLLAVVVTPIVNRKKTGEEKKTLPLVPYLAVGYIVAWCVPCIVETIKFIVG